MKVTHSNRNQPPGPLKAGAAPARSAPTQSPAASEPIDKAEKQELEDWNERLRPEMGVLKTPPAGSTPPQIKAAQGYIEDLLDQVAGEDLTKRKLELRVEVFSGNVPQASLDDDMGAEQSWKESHPDKEWPIRSWYQTPDGSEKPIYRLVVNLGLLNTLESKEELAFVLAQQAEILLDHDKRDPDNEELLEPATRSLVDSRAWQADADRAAIARVAAAGLNPRGALSALNKLYAKNPIDYPDNDLNRGLLAAAHGHEHEGLRLGLVQAEVESYVRRAHPAASAPLQELPQELKISEAPGYDREVPDLERFKQDYRSLATKLAGDSTPAWMFGDGVPPIEVGTITLSRGTVENKETALVGLAQHLEQNENLTPQQKVDGFLRFLLSLDGSPLPEDQSFSPEGQAVISQLFEKNGPQWEAGKFLNTLSNPSGDTKSLHRALVQRVVFNETFQNLVGASLPGLAEGVPVGWVTNPLDQKQELEELSGLIDHNHSGGRNGWPLGKAIDQATLSFISAQDGPALAQQTTEAGVNRAMTLSNELLANDTPNGDFQIALREATKGLVQASAQVREDHARVRLKLPLSEPGKVTDYLRQLGTSETWAPFSDQFEADFRGLLRDLVHVSVSQPDFLDSNDRPDSYPEPLERRLASLLDGADPQDQDKVLTKLSRHIQHDRRVKGHSARREWLKTAAQAIASVGPDKLVEKLAAPDLSQHSNLLKKTLVEGYLLKPEDLPTTSTADLKVLRARVEADEFVPKREDFPTESAYERALDDYAERQSRIEQVTDRVIPLESRLVLSKMALLGHDAETSQQVASTLSLDNFRQILQGAEAAVERAETISALDSSESTEHVGADAGAFMMDGFLSVQDKVESLADWHDLANRSIDFSKGGLEARVGTKRALADNLFERLQKLEAKALREWLGKEKVLELLSPAQSSDLLVQSLAEKVGPEVAPEALSKAVEELNTSYELTEKHPVAYAAMRDKIADKARLQPSTVDLVFPHQERGVTDTNESYAKQARALSGVIAMARERSAQEQIDTVEYLMGRQKVMPGYLEAAADSQSFAPLVEALQTTRQELLDADSQTRVMVANSFLAGPSGVMRTEEGKRSVIDHFLKDLHPDNRVLADKIARAVLFSHGEADTLAVAFILGQKPEEPKDGQDPGKDGKLDEATILNRLFDAYGVPGIKMKQYLAFTSEFADFKDAFESAQDAALPLNYYQVLRLVQKRFGDDWPEDLKIDRVLGSGSVNVAIRYTNQESGQREVVSLGREDIQESTRYDFQRFNKFIEELTRTPEDRETFGYVLGLLNLISDSVALEFNKEQALEVQKSAFKTYQHARNGWTVKSIDAFRVENLGLFMEEAKGKTARKTYTQDPDTYSSAMEAMAGAEFGVLKGQTSRNNWWPEPLFANPDFHDGQVLIDKENKTVTILDFGQAVPISNEDRDAGLDMLTVIGKADSPKTAAKRLNKRYFEGRSVLKPETLAPILKRKDRMDCFIHLLSTLSSNGADVPLSSVHWILGVNRQMALGEKIGKPIDTQVRNMVLNHKVGLPLGVYNTAHASKETVVWMANVAADTAVNVTKSLIHLVGGWFGWEPSDDPQQSELPKTPPAKPKVSYPSWKPDFGGTLPTRPAKEATEPAKKALENPKNPG